MKALPPHVVVYQRTGEFTERNVPSGLLRSHTTKSGVWARIKVLEGRLRYRILTEPPEEHVLTPELFAQWSAHWNDLVRFEFLELAELAEPAELEALREERGE